jgi:hypothetical protein
MQAKISILAGMTETRRNWPKFFPRWNKGVSCSGLHTGTTSRPERNDIYNFESNSILIKISYMTH